MKNISPIGLKTMVCAAFLVLASSAVAVRAQTTSAAEVAVDSAPSVPASVSATLRQPDAARPTGKERFRRYLNNTVEAFALIGAGVLSAFDQTDNAPPEWKRNAVGYERRFASNLGESAIQETVADGLEEGFKQDGKFYRSRKRDFGSRLKNGLPASVSARTLVGKWVFNPSRIAGAYAGQPDCNAKLVSRPLRLPRRFAARRFERCGEHQIRTRRGIYFSS